MLYRIVFKLASGKDDKVIFVQGGGEINTRGAALARAVSEIKGDDPHSVHIEALAGTLLGQ